MGVASKLKTKVHIARWKIQAYADLPAVRDCLTADGGSTRVHNCNFRVSWERGREEDGRRAWKGREGGREGGGRKEGRGGGREGGGRKEGREEDGRMEGIHTSRIFKYTTFENKVLSCFSPFSFRGGPPVGGGCYRVGQCL